MKRRVIAPDTEPLITKKLLLVGDGNVGKTTYIKRLLGIDDDGRYIPTIGTEVHPVHFPHRGVRLNIFDIAGQEKLSGMRNAYYMDTDYCIMMIDNQTSRQTIKFWHDDVSQVCGNMTPTIVVYNKDDRRLENSTHHFIYDRAVPRFNISTRNSGQDKCFDPIFHFLDTYG